MIGRADGMVGRVEELEAAFGREAVEELLGIFVAEGGAAIEKIAAALPLGPDQLKARAHAFKGECSSLGADDLAAICAHIEEASEQGARLTPHVEALRAAYARTCRSLEQVFGIENAGRSH